MAASAVHLTLFKTVSLSFSNWLYACLSIYLFVHLSVCLRVYSSLLLPVHLSLTLPRRLSARLYFPTSVRPYVYSSIPSSCLSVRLSDLLPPSLFVSVHLFFFQLVHISLALLVCASIRPTSVCPCFSTPPSVHLLVFPNLCLFLFISSLSLPLSYSHIYIAGVYSYPTDLPKPFKRSFRSYNWATPDLIYRWEFSFGRDIFDIYKKCS